MDDPNSLYALYPELMAGRYEKAIKNDEKEVDLLRPNSLDKVIGMINLGNSKKHYYQLNEFPRKAA